MSDSSDEPRTYSGASGASALAEALRLQHPAIFEALGNVLYRADGGFRLDLQAVSADDDATAAALSALVGPARAPDAPITRHHHDLARSAQALYELTFFHLLNHLHARHGSPRLALAGYCAMNSVANGRILRHTPFKQVYVQAAAGDAGGALGAALAVSVELGQPRAFTMTHAHWGPDIDDTEVRALLQARQTELAAQGCTVTHVPDEAALCAQVAQALADGAVVGWAQGRMEWGPRALGGRSILGDPRRTDMKDRLNLQVKRREPFRPFAPSVLREAVPDWFEQDDDVPFMMQVHPVRPERRAQVPAITHVDGSGRLQTVDAAAQPRYHRLISAFAAITGVPMLLNTSFNENEPVVCRPAEALACFLRTQMDLLVMGDWVVQRPASNGSASP